LKNIIGVSDRSIKIFIDNAGTLKNVFQLRKAELTSLGFTDKQAAAISNKNINDFDVNKELLLIKENDVNVIPFESTCYPQQLKNISDPPSLLYGFGDMNHLSKPSIAIVGSRRASKNSCEFAAKLAYDLSGVGFNIISGFAYGIDINAHLGALKAGTTTAVLGSGLMRIYPKEHRKYMSEMVEKGSIISEFSLETPPEGYNFPRRNRIISGLSLGVVVVEAAPGSGSLITAKCALDQNREIFAVPASPALYNKAANKLLKSGAKLVENYMDVVEEFSHLANNLKMIDKKNKDYIITFESKVKKMIYEYLKVAPLTCDELCMKLNISAPEILAHITEMELDKIVFRDSGNKYYIRSL